MKRETFIKAIEAIDSQYRYDIEMTEKLGEAFPDAFSANLMYDNGILFDALIKVLKEETNDNACEEESWIEWFCYETAFGRKGDQLPAFDEKGNRIKMDNAGDLYDFLKTL